MKSASCRDWQGASDGESWEVEIEHDCFSEGELFVVSVWTRHQDEDGAHETLATPSSEQAREMAATLIAAADAADRANTADFSRTEAP